MPIKAECPYCKARFNAESHYVGKRGKCSKCDQSFIVEPISNADQPEPDITRESAVVDWTNLSNQESDFMPKEDVRLSTPVDSPKPYSLKSYPTPSFSGLKILSWGLLIMFCLGFFAGALMLVMGIINGYTPAMITGVSILYATIPFLLVKELITLMLHLEQNTRRAAEGIEQLTQTH